VQRHDIGRQVQRSSSGSTPHDRPTIPQICSSCPLALDRRRQSALRYPAVVSNPTNTHRVRRQSPPIYPPLRSRTTSAIASPTISHSARGTQIPITHAAPPTYPFPRFPPLEVCGRRPRPARLHLHGAGIRKPSQQETSLFGNGRAFRLHRPGQKFQHCDTARLSSVAKTSRDPENTTAERSRAFARSDCLHLVALISERASPRGFSIGLRAGGLCRTARPFRLLGRRRSHGDRVVEPRAAYRLDFHWR
jgi:hypothetical protein